MKKVKKEILNSKVRAEKDRILDFAFEKFLKEGFYKTTMDSLASDLRISKKTIYKHYPTKDALVEDVVSRIMQNMSSKIDEIIKSEHNALGKVGNVMQLIGNFSLKISDNWLQDLRIHLPLLWERVDDFRTKKMYGILTKIIEQGKVEGYFIDKPNELIILIFVSSVRSIVSPDFLYHQKLNIQEAFRHTFEILFNGILTTKGKKEFKKIFSKGIQ
ncbi:MAG: TetR/AcrR family transcriptional regulator [Ignavibacteriaceae bacterium]|jgi:AcrR family transcriptional regulator